MEGAIDDDGYKNRDVEGVPKSDGESDGESDRDSDGDGEDSSYEESEESDVLHDSEYEIDDEDKLNDNRKNVLRLGGGRVYRVLNLILLG